MTSYIGKQPTIGNFQKCDAISVVNGQATYGLTVNSVAVYPESANHVLCSLNGILQAPTDSFTISSSNIVFASNLATGDVIDFVMILGNVLDLGVPSDNTVTASKLNNDIISGQTALTSEPADTDEFLVSDAGTIKRIDYSLIKSSPAMELLATVDADNTARSVSFDGYFSSTYKNYKLVGSNITLSTGTNSLRVRFRRSNADITASKYYDVAVRYYIVDASLTAVGGYDNSWSRLLNENTSSTAGYNSSFSLDLYDPLGTNNYKNATFQTVGFDNGANNRHHFENGGLGLVDSTDALSGITVITDSSSVNLNRGNFKLYGIK
jgi:hypothetical protein